jgi:hypothetical protein
MLATVIAEVDDFADEGTWKGRIEPFNVYNRETEDLGDAIPERNS